MQFKYIKEMFFINNENMKITKKTHSAIEKEAIRWLEARGIKYGSSSIHNGNFDKAYWHYSCGTLIIDVRDLGDYYYPFIMKMAYFAFAGNETFLQGYEFGKTNGKGVISGIDQDKNPFKDMFYESAAWDSGYRLGVSPYTIESFKTLFNG